MVGKRHNWNLGFRGGACSQDDKAQKGTGTVEEFFFERFPEMRRHKVTERTG